MARASVKHKILETASNLFYYQGYNLTGVNQIIAEAGVAKGSLFQHFPTKEDLCVAYLAQKNNNWITELLVYTNDINNGFNKALSAFDFLKESSPKENYRGCSFLNILSEVPDNNIKILNEVKKNKAALRDLFKEWLKESPVNNLSDIAYILFEGAIIESQVQKSVWPVDTAKEALVAIRK